MANILIVDQLEQTGILMKSLLGRYYGVSLSDNFSDAMKKIETALFDIVIVELERRNAEVDKFIQEAKQILPELPIIALTAHQENLQELSAVNMISRPFRSATLMQAIQNGLLVYTTNTVTSVYHRPLSFTAEISQGENKSLEPLKCSVTDLSVRGMLVEPAAGFPGRAGNEKIQFQNFFKTLCSGGRMPSAPIRTNIVVKEQQPIVVYAKVAFVDNISWDTYKRAGLTFKDAGAQKTRLMELLKTA